MKCWTCGFHIMHDGEALGSYLTPEQAAKALANGESGWPAIGNPHDLGIPEELAQ